MVEMITEGYKVAGLAGPSGVYTSNLRPPEITREELLKAGRGIKPATLASHTTGRDDDLDAEVIRLTLEEVSLGWLEETSVADLVARFGDDWLPNRRFGMRQAQKVRCVDDFSASLVNSAFGDTEKIVMGGLGEVAAAATLLRTAGQQWGSWTSPSRTAQGGPRRCTPTSPRAKLVPCTSGR